MEILHDRIEIKLISEGSLETVMKLKTSNSGIRKIKKTEIDLYNINYII